jgi:hypothetical protein
MIMRRTREPIMTRKYFLIKEVHANADGMAHFDPEGE